MLAFHPHFGDAQFQPSASPASSTTSNTSKSGHPFHQHRKRCQLSTRSGPLGGATSLAWATHPPSNNALSSHKEKEEKGEQMWLTVGFADGSVRVYDTFEAVNEARVGNEVGKADGEVNSSGTEKNEKSNENREDDFKAATSPSFPSPFPLVAVLHHNDQVLIHLSLI